MVGAEGWCGRAKKIFQVWTL